MSYVRNNIMSEIATHKTICDNPSCLTHFLGKKGLFFYFYNGLGFINTHLTLNNEIKKNIRDKQ